jgi:hypothetical protein
VNVGTAMVSPLPVEPPQTVAPSGAPDRRAGMSVRKPCVYVWIMFCTMQ